MKNEYIEMHDEWKAQRLLHIFEILGARVHWGKNKLYELGVIKAKEINSVQHIKKKTWDSFIN